MYELCYYRTRNVIKGGKSLIQLEKLALKTIVDKLHLVSDAGNVVVTYIRVNDDVFAITALGFVRHYTRLASGGWMVNGSGPVFVS